MAEDKGKGRFEQSIPSNEEIVPHCVEGGAEANVSDCAADAEESDDSASRRKGHLRRLDQPERRDGGVAYRPS